jgi:hypothetical protein
MRCIGLALVFLPFVTTPGWAADYYASSTGKGSACTKASPCSPRAFFTDGEKAAAGNVLWLLDGTYHGADYMITPGLFNPGLSGNSSAPITVKAINDGAVLIDGDGVNLPAQLSKNSWFVLEGFNVCCSSAGVILLKSGSNNNIIRRVVAWHAFDGGPKSGTNNQVVAIVYSNNNLVEDSAAFGTGRYIFATYAGTENTFRRTWARWEGYTSNTGPKTTYQLLYHSNITVCENCLGTWTAERLSDCAQLGFDPAIFKMGTDANTLTLLLGSIAYQKTSAICNPYAGVYPEGEVGGAQHIRITDVVSHVPISGVRPFNFSVVTDGIATRITGIKGRSSTTLKWKVTNWNEATTVARVPNVFTAQDAANVCFRYQGGLLTTIPLWPWPMDQRIQSALVTAGSSGLDGTNGTVTSEIESIFGEIPSLCRDE